METWLSTCDLNDWKDLGQADWNISLAAWWPLTSRGRRICCQSNIYVYMCIYIRRPPLGGHQAAKSMFAIAYQLFSVIHSAIICFSSPPVCNCHSAVYQSGIWFKKPANWRLVSLILECFWAWGRASNPNLGVCSQPGSSQGIPWKSLKFKPISRTLKSQKKWAQGHQKTPKCDPNPSHRTPNHRISGKSEII